MSRGFVKEDDLEHAGTDLPERPISEHPNYVTPNGLRQLNQEAQALDKLRASLINRDESIAKQELAKVDRDLRYLSARLESTILVDPTDQDKNTILFGAHVVVEDEAGIHQTFIIVGEDEANMAERKVSYVSPIARALIGKKIGDNVIWKRPAGDIELTILNINYP
jgi:transcription elongation factor GreB